MSSLAENEELLQVFNISYDRKLLANHGVTFAILLRKYLSRANCLDAEIVVGEDGKADLSHPTHALIRVCLECAWSDMKEGKKWSKYDKSAGGGGESSKSNGGCKSACGKD